MRKILIPVAVFLVSLGAQAGFGHEAPDYVSLDRDGVQLRRAFNADSGKIRVIMLVAPT